MYRISALCNLATVSSCIRMGSVAHLSTSSGQVHDYSTRDRWRPTERREKKKEFMRNCCVIIHIMYLMSMCF